MIHFNVNNYLLYDGDEIKMTDISKLCMVCLGEINEDGKCPNCGKGTDIEQLSPLLPIKTLIAQRYLIAKNQKKNSEGFTYSAYDLTLEKPVSVREFFPEKFAERDADELTVIPREGNEEAFAKYLGEFNALWTKIMRLKGLTSLINVTEVIHANGTVYAVYDESERITLRDYLLNTDEGYIPWEKARILFMPVLSTLGTLHTSGIIHKAINPTSFIFSKTGKLKLTDFSILPVRVDTGEFETEIFDGYAPLEQYQSKDKIGAHTDIYSFCSVLYRSLIGTTPIDAKTRALNDQMMIPAKFAEQLPPYVINALINGMSIEAADRTNNIEQLRSDLSASPRVIGASAKPYEPEITPAPQTSVTASTIVTVKNPAPAAKTPAKAPTGSTAAPHQPQQQKKQSKAKDKKKNSLIAVLIALLVILVIGIGILIAALVDRGDPSKPEETTVQSSTIVSVPNFIGGHISDIITNEQYTAYFKFQTVEDFSATVMAGMVIDQNIPAKSQASVGETIILTVSKGPKSFQLQDVTGLTYEQAEQIFTSQGLRCVKSAMHNDGTHQGGTIAETIPPKDSVVKEGDVITVVVYTTIEETTTSSSAGTGNSVEEFLESIMTTVPSQQTSPIQ